jgi:hypothetical protein
VGSPQDVLVIGGGIAGLATARALSRIGIETEVVERSASWAHPGTGVYLPANAVRALDALGVKAALLDRAHEIARQRFLDHRGRLLLDVALADIWDEVGPCVAITHQDLHEVLREGISVEMGTTVTSLHPDVLARSMAEDEPLEQFGWRRRSRVRFVRAQTHRREHTRNLPAALRNMMLCLAGRTIFRGNYAPLTAEI